MTFSLYNRCNASFEAVFPQLGRAFEVEILSIPYSILSIFKNINNIEFPPDPQSIPCGHTQRTD